MRLNATASSESRRAVRDGNGVARGVGPAAALDSPAAVR